MICSKCGKRPAVVFVSNNTGETPTKGYCLTCAKEMGIKPVEDLIAKMGLTDDDLETVQEQMDSLMGEDGMKNLMESMNVENLAEQMEKFEEESEDNGDFTPGGTPTFPFFNNLFSGNSEPKQGEGRERKDRRKSRKTDKKRKHLNLYCENLTEKAAEGRIDNIIGRDKEIERVIQILSRRTKNNPCLIGEPGVGKTAIAEGLALRIASGNVPLRLADKEIYLLDLTSLVAGTQFRGQFESRIKGLTKEITEAGNIILFIDEVHNLVGAGDSSEGTMNAANILKPALSRGEVQVIGATTFNEYRKHIEKDSALERRFQPVKVGEPSVADTIEVIRGVKGYYEAHHRVRVEDDIVRKTVIFSERYINDRFLPDKAIDLLDESCACAALRNKEMERYDRLMMSKKRLSAEMEEIESAEEVNYEQLADVRSKIARTDSELREIDMEKVNAPVTEEDIAKVIELWTGIPSSRIRENELSKLADLEDELKKKIIGQDEAVAALSAAIRRSRVRISPRRRPASFIFVGPTGVGKTELVKVLSQQLFDTPETLIRLDMSEFMEKHSVSKIIGSPPGYVGYDEAGQVTEKVRRRPYSVLLFDEVEKAHPDVLNILLQILDEGRVTDAQGRTVNFENTVIVMTSNAGSEKRENALGFGKQEDDMVREKAIKGLREFLRPEFIARVDEVIVFRSLNSDDYKAIAGLMLDEYKEPLAEKGIRFSYDENLCEFIAEKAAGGTSGARDLRNYIRKNVEDKITNEIIANREGEISAVNALVNGDEVKLEVI